MWNGIATIENSMVVPQKIKNRIAYVPAIPLLGIPLKRTESQSLEEYLYVHVHGSIIHNSSTMETTQVSIDG